MTLLLVCASLAFLASSILYAMAPGIGVNAVIPLLPLDPDIAGSNAALRAMARPEGGALRLLLGMVWLAVVVNALRAVLAAAGATGGQGRPVAAPPELSSGPSSHPSPSPSVAAPAPAPPATPSPLAAPWPVIVALLAGALWPWAAQLPAPGPALALVTVMAGAAIWAAIKRRQNRGPGRHITGTVELFAGWATVALYSSFAAVLIVDLKISAALAAVVSVLLMMVTAVEVQLRLGNAVTYSFAVIWAMIGIAAATMRTDLTISTAAIIAFAALVAVVVRVLS